MLALIAPDLAAALPTQLRLTTIYRVRFVALFDGVVGAVEDGADHDGSARPVEAPQLQAA